MTGNGEAARQRAIEAWSELASGARVVAAETLSGGRHSDAVRLRTRAGRSVVAKLRPKGGLALERAIHEQILPELGVATPACLGFVSGSGDAPDVLFLEDLGDRAFQPSDPAHQRAAGRWLGRCHAASAATAIPARVPRRSLKQEREQLAATRLSLAAAQGNEALGEPGAARVARVLELLAVAEERWDAWEAAAASVPAVLTHGAFVTRNVRMRGQAATLETLPFDWDHVAVRSPAIDLAQVPGGSRGFAANASLRHYRAAAAERGLALEAETVGALAALGTLVRAAACVGWLVPSLVGLRGAHALSELDLYRGALDATLGA